MTGYQQALGVILDAARPLAAEPCRTVDALGRITAGPVTSNEDLPPFDNSAMDGFALHAGGQTLAAGTSFEVAGSQSAGDAHQRAGSGAWEIMTGARMPDGLDTVVPVEQVEILQRDAGGRPSRIQLTVDVEPGRHVRKRGEDVRRDATIMAAGTLMQAQHLMLLAGLGISEVAVVRRPRVALINTGRELVDDPAQPLASGQIRNSNGPFLATRLAAAGAELVYRQTVNDEPQAFHAALAAARQAGAEVVISTGAVSMGRHDFIPDALRVIGAEIGFHKVKIRPGRPLLFARLVDGMLFFGLPGNPVSSAVGLRFFVEPALRKMLGLPPERPLRLPLAQDFSKKAGLRFHLKGQVHCDAGGRLQARVLQGQESFRIQPMLASNAWVVVDEDVASLQAGELVDVHGPGHLQAVSISAGPDEILLPEEA
ncbi:molybdopterin biosynthesis protein [Lysobacter concretionis Ko07 = DSM 16239]|uniref:Molybdopterin molybdenumtransferase n=1 Tax=Lysobacter concretionis Ko07 = DSM 16239 TaxID=1122185 RepID=A0A0A0EPF4_9GAMM|nr:MULTISPECIES: gephyrin-like molybdotransferase Glp [Lysobacter]KGM52299.1 molybdopterin biosynthesis protein [Lysobacter concretionis Ko07 = DSM 16239]QOD91967.1 molybdopterin molybdotransferase MoeA [Lysobacter sp. CW239]